MQRELKDEGGEETTDCIPNPDALEEVAKSVDRVQQLDLPLGWAEENAPKGFWDWFGWVFG